ncbi:hypothetical protein ACINKY_21240 [Paenibacillus illinoisensis]|uniref:Uncharacterized protein n=1 Tax=Paenibacillus illinoisensis TaxID=59845 RepID=A0ABW8HYG0_9BACL
MKKMWEGFKKRTYNTLEFFMKFILLFILFVSTYGLVGFPITREEFLDILPSFITIFSVSLVFYNVNRTQKKNFQNEIKKFRRDTRIKVADELIDCFAGLDGFIREIKLEVREDNFTVEKRAALVNSFGEHSNRINSIIYKRKEVIEYCENVFERDKGKRLTYMIWLTLTLVETKLIRLDKENWSLNLEEIQETLHSDILKHREEVVDALYGDLFKQKTYDDLSFGQKLMHGHEGSYFLPITFVVAVVLYSLFYFKSYLLTLFIK